MARADVSRWQRARTKLAHLKHTLVGVLGVVVVFGGYALKDGSIAHYIAAHPGLAAAVSITLGILRALDKALGKREGNGQQ